MLSLTTARGPRQMWSGSSGKGKGIQREGSWAKLSPWDRVRSRLVLGQQFQEEHHTLWVPVPETLRAWLLPPLISGMGTGNEEEPVTLQELGVTARRPRGLGIPTSLPRLRRKNFLPPGHLLRLAALTQCKGAAQVRVLQRVSDQPSGPFPREGDVLQLRLCAPAPFAFVPQTSTARLLGLRA